MLKSLISASDAPTRSLRNLATSETLCPKFVISSGVRVASLSLMISPGVEELYNMTAPSLKF